MSRTPPVSLRGSNIEAEWPIWRLVVEGVASLREINETWHLGDVLDANEALDAMAAARRGR